MAVKQSTTKGRTKSMPDPDAMLAARELGLKSLAKEIKIAETIASMDLPPTTAKDFYSKAQWRANSIRIQCTAIKAVMQLTAGLVVHGRATTVEKEFAKEVIDDVRERVKKAMSKADKGKKLPKIEPKKHKAGSSRFLKKYT